MTSGSVAANGSGDVASEGGAVFYDAILVVKELDGIHADCGCTAFFFLLRGGGRPDPACMELMPASPLVMRR